MTRPTIDFGIDLGTTNSAIAVLAEGRPLPIRNNEHHELTPSVVAVARTGAISVGLPANRQAERRPELVAREFKRAMGTDRTFTLGGRTMTPEELSAEVLKALRADVQARYGDDIRAAVITVPAMFTFAAREATARAARLAGIEKAVLLQEPIAAGIAYGFQDAAARGYWVVYDLGGGTFDTSLLTIREGRLQVVDHAGDEFLGGKNFDNLLVDFAVDELRGRYVLDGLVRGDDPKHRGLYARLKQACEGAKIVLSRQDSASIELELVGATDDAGTPIDDAVGISRSRYEQLIATLVDRTTQSVLELLKRNSLEPGMIARVIMVGGPTLTPYIRERVRRDTGIEVETSVDPMTVVAQGAAIFAASQLNESSDPLGPNGPVGAIRVDLKYAPVSDTVDTLIGGRVPGGVPAGLTVQLERGDGGWSSGRLPIANGTFVATVVLRERQPNAFRLRLFDAGGRDLPVSPDRLAITHGLVVDEPPLSRSLGVAVDAGSDKLLTKILLSHGTRMPASARHVFHTVRSVAPGQPGAARIYVVEGEEERADRNDHVGHIQLDGSTVQRPLPAGSEIEVTFRVDMSGTLTVEAYILHLDETLKLVCQDVNRPVPETGVLESQLRAEEQRLEKIGGVASVGEAPAQIAEVQRAIDEARTGDADAAMRAQRRLHELQGQLDGAQAAADLPLLEAEWNELLPRTRQMLAQYGEPESRQRLLILEREGQEALAARDQARLRQRLDQLNQLYWGTLTAQPGFWIGFYQDLVEQQGAMADQSTARLAVQEGGRALERQDFEALQQVCRRLWLLLPDSGRQSMSHGLPDVGVRG